MTSQIIIMTKSVQIWDLSTKNSRARREMAREIIPTVLESLLLVDYRKTTEKSIETAFWGQTVISLYGAQKISLNYGIFLQN